jgi:hypothetical protein
VQFLFNSYIAFTFIAPVWWRIWSCLEKDWYLSYLHEWENVQQKQWELFLWNISHVIEGLEWDPPGSTPHLARLAPRRGGGGHALGHTRSSFWHSRKEEPNFLVFLCQRRAVELKVFSFSRGGHILLFWCIRFREIADIVNINASPTWGATSLSYLTTTPSPSMSST